MNTQTASAPLWLRLSCRLWGHVVDNDVFRRSAEERRYCRCGVEYLPEDGRRTHVRHTVSCFLRHHTYVRLADRGGVHEYVCVRCGHPLVFPAGTDRFAGTSRFAKKVRYACGLFGHRVTAVAARQGFVEYACHCGHSFLKHAAGERKVRHPLRCFFLAHRIRFVTHREGYAEYVCDDCGHPFCFVVQPGPRSLDRRDQSGDSRPQAPVARGVGVLPAAPGVVRGPVSFCKRARRSGVFDLQERNFS